MVEVEAFGTWAGGVALLINREPADAVAGVGQPATFAVGVNVVNGDSSLVPYQWQRNGDNIPGATDATYTTPPTLPGNHLDTFRCIVGYPELPDRPSAEASLLVNLAFQSSAFSNRPLYAGWSVAQIVNGLRTDVVHGDVDIEAGFAYEVDLGTGVAVDEILIFPRQDGCCPDRLQNFRVSLHDDNEGQPGPAVWGVDLFTDGTNPGSTAGSRVRITSELDPAGRFEGRWIRMLALDDPIPNYHLQMNEIEVYGSYLDTQPRIEISVPPADTGTVPGRTATFEIVARVINGDPSLLTYQWTRDGELIPGANLTMYTTPPLAPADENLPFRCVVSYPGVPDVISEAGRVIFDGNYAKGQPAFSNRPEWGALSVNALVNGNLNDFIHGDTQIAPGYAYEIQLGADVEVTSIVLYPRQDGCCPDRFTNFRVELLEDEGGQAGNRNWSTELFTDGSNPGSGPGLSVPLTAADGTGTFRGAWLRILSLDDPVGDYALQIAEVEVFGTGTLIAPPQVTIAVGESGLEIRWTSGVLESAPTLESGWQSVPGATSPYTAEPTEGSRYYRARL